MIPKRITNTYTYGTVVGSRGIQVMSTDPRVQLDLVVFEEIRCDEPARLINWVTKVKFLNVPSEGILRMVQETLAKDYLLECTLKVPEGIAPYELTVGDLVTCIREQVYAVEGWERLLRPQGPKPEEAKGATPPWFDENPPIVAPTRSRKIDERHVTLSRVPGTYWWVMWDNAPIKVTVTQAVITIPPAEGKRLRAHTRAHFETLSGVRGDVDESLMFTSKAALLASF